MEQDITRDILSKYSKLKVVWFNIQFLFFLNGAETDALDNNWAKIDNNNNDKSYNPSHHSTNVETKCNAIILEWY